MSLIITGYVTGMLYFCKNSDKEMENAPSVITRDIVHKQT